MSKVQLQGNASGTGIFTIASPNSNTDRTLTLPDNTGTILTGSSAIQKSQLPAGTVLQVVSGNQTTPTSIANTGAYIATPLQATITPISSSSRIVIIYSFQWYATGAIDSTAAIYRNGNIVFNGTTKVQITGINQTVAASAVDSPASTSALTYRIYMQNGGAGSLTYNIDNYPTSLILMEIAG